MGIGFFIIGLFKKVIIADSLSPWVKVAFNNAQYLTLIDAWLGAISYTFQLYYDFSGYSDMAIGLGLMFNLICLLISIHLINQNLLLSFGVDGT